MPSHTLIAALLALLAALFPLPAMAALVPSWGPYDTLSAIPTTGALFDSRIGVIGLGAGSRPPGSWTNAFVVGNGVWEVGAGGTVAGPGTKTAVAFDNLAPWMRVSLPAPFGQPLALIAGAVLPGATGSITAVGIGLATSWRLDAGQVHLNLGTRTQSTNVFGGMQGILGLHFHHPLSPTLSAGAEMVLQAGGVAGENYITERLGLTRIFNESWIGDLSVTVGSPLDGLGGLVLAPGLGLTYQF